MKNVTITDAELTAYSGEHVYYELQYLWYAANELSKIAKPTPMASVFIESFGIHLRNLIDFFYTKAGKELNDDVIAADFCPGWNEAIPAALDAARVRANKELNHLTLQRKSGLDPTKPWDIAGLFNEITAVARTFAARADPAKLSPEVGKWLTLFHRLPSATATATVIPSLMATNSTATMVVMSALTLVQEPE